MTTLIASIRRGVPAGLEEIAQLGRTLSRRRDDILAFFDHHASNGPTEAINGPWKPCAATPSDSATSPTTESAHSYTAAHSTNSSMHSDLRRASKRFGDGCRAR
jgi:Transposase